MFFYGKNMIATTFKDYKMVATLICIAIKKFAISAICIITPLS